MKRLLELFYNYQSSTYKGVLYLLSCAFIVYMLPIKNQFNFEFSKGKTWSYESLFAPFDFAIIKSEAEIETEKNNLRTTALTYFDVDTTVVSKVKVLYDQKFEDYFDLRVGTKRYKTYFDYGHLMLNTFYEKGILPINYKHLGGENAALIQDRNERDVLFESLINLDLLSSHISNRIEPAFKGYSKNFYNLFFEILEPNLTYNTPYNAQVLNELYSSVSPTRDIVSQGELIISSGELIEGQKWEKLYSLKQQYTTEQSAQSDTLWVIFGYSLIVGLLLLLLLVFIYKYRYPVFENNTKMTFIFFNVLVMIGLSSFLIQFDSAYLYALPICIFPLITKTFFDPRLGLFIHVLSVLLVGFIAPNSFEYVLVQILAGIVTILSVSELYKRANLFISVAQITLVYLVSYLAFFAIRVGEIQSFDVFVFILFIANGLLTLFVQPLIYFYEKVFNLVSDVSLLELSDTNSKLLKQLSNASPGTFHHSLQVANLAEAAAVAIDANVLLTRVGALYHDIGKINNPSFFSENQRGRVSPHDDLSPKESAKIIIQHVLDGIELAKKNNLPDRVIDFIRTHHGTSRVHYFFKKQQDLSLDFDEQDFRYSGPKPFSKETAIIMMVDSVEAASKSLKEPSVDLLDSFVTKIIDQQVEEKQLINSNITLAEIETVKKILINKLVNIYQLRVAYPE